MGVTRRAGVTSGPGTAAAAPALQCSGLDVSLGRLPVLRGLDLEVGPGEVMAVLGPSGSGKTTLLHAIAGFIQPDAGEIRLGGRLVASRGALTPPDRRSIGMVFQNYALWPHLDALETVAYPIRRSGAGTADARARAAVMLGRLGLDNLADRRPSQLSGGEQQRVGLARALARGADLYLFDEPTVHLDAWLRERFQEEMAEASRATGAAAVYATHDAGEALAVADRVALLRDGAVAQTGTPAQVYEQPMSLWAARLTGPASLLRVPVTSGDGGRSAGIAGVDCRVDGPLPTAGDVATLLVRPGWAVMGGPLSGVIQQAWYRGAHTDYRLETEMGSVLVRQPGPPRSAAGDQVGWSLERGWLVDDVAAAGVGAQPPL